MLGEQPSLAGDRCYLSVGIMGSPYSPAYLGSRSQHRESLSSTYLPADNQSLLSDASLPCLRLEWHRFVPGGS